MPATTLDRGRFRGALLGLACGDAVGTSVEFSPRGSFPPVTGMKGGGPFQLDAGRWTDDTSMALCLAESLLTCSGMDPQDQMQRYLSWYRRGVWSSKGYCFDIGNATRAALERFEANGDPLAGSTDPNAAGNGSLMRLAPVAMFFASDRQAALAAAKLSSQTTHATVACLKACEQFAGFLVDALQGKDLNLAPYAQLRQEQVRGTGYVVQSLQAALWAVATTDSFEACILRAVNLGDDADTTAAIAGQLAGAIYGVRGIPAPWRELLYRGAEIAQLADRLFEAVQAKG